MCVMLDAIKRRSFCLDIRIAKNSWPGREEVEGGGKVVGDGGSMVRMNKRSRWNNLRHDLQVGLREILHYLCSLGNDNV